MATGLGSFNTMMTQKKQLKAQEHERREGLDFSLMVLYEPKSECFWKIMKLSLNLKEKEQLALEVLK